MQAVVEDRNQQYRVQPGDRVLIARNGAVTVGETVTFERVCLLTGESDGQGARIGAPYVDGASVTAVVLRQDVKGQKLIIQKIKRRKGFRRRTGFRPRFTEIQIEAIHGA